MAELRMCESGHLSEIKSFLGPGGACDVVRYVGFAVPVYECKFAFRFREDRDYFWRLLNQNGISSRKLQQSLDGEAMIYWISPKAPYEKVEYLLDKVIRKTDDTSKFF